MAIAEPQAYCYSTTDSTNNVSYDYQGCRIYEVRWYSNFDSAVTTSAQGEIEVDETPKQNWAELRKYFIGFNAKKHQAKSRGYIIRQPTKCHRNIRRERIQRFMKKL